MADEVELKLDLTPACADAVEASSLLADAPRHVQQHAIYFDTPDRKLARAGFSLRIRRADGRRVQTIKRAGKGAAGLFARSEWEREIEGDTPILDDATPLRAMLGDAVEAIAPVFAVEIERRIWMVEEGGTTIELAIDRGEAVAGERRAPISEIELEVKSGGPAAAFALARKIDAIAPARLGVRSKSERGYALLEAKARSVKAEPVALARGMAGAEAFRRIVESCVRQFRLNEALLMAGRDAAALHQARVALRRLRSAFALFRPMLGESGAELRGELRWLAGEFGDARNLDVLLDQTRPGPLRDRLSAAREAAYDRVDELLSSPRARRLMLDLVEWIWSENWRHAPGATIDGDQSARTLAATALGRFRRKVKKGGRRLAELDDDARHEVRKDAKKLRYAGEFFAGLFDREDERRRHKRFVAALEALQDALGALNDLATAPEVMGKVGLVDPPEAEALRRERKTSLVARATDARADLLDTRRFW
ncbi:CHAD domain-containing protein [Sphingomonas quercus]|uniref:CHAD domain-containing protein n=1 Tax=Sphingomonas quercus TaxID=2842451 RepID=A0ABS6BDQ6_9SPHN|nr:CHAD domain-containing protein [Sphingomonas quercus]MBU3076445.1 CHAD domain-containing protein [Sphingomonas quercus]